MVIRENRVQRAKVDCPDPKEMRVLMDLKEKREALESSVRTATSLSSEIPREAQEKNLLFGSILSAKSLTRLSLPRKEMKALRDQKGRKEKKEHPEFPEHPEHPVRMEQMVQMVKMEGRDCRERRVSPVMLELKEKLAILEVTAHKDLREREAIPAKRDLLESKDRKDNKEMTERKDKEGRREYVSPTTTTRATAIHTPSFDIHKPIVSLSALLITNPYGLDTLWCSLKGTATDFHKISEVLDLA